MAWGLDNIYVQYLMDSWGCDFFGVNFGCGDWLSIKVQEKELSFMEEQQVFLMFDEKFTGLDVLDGGANIDLLFVVLLHMDGCNEG